MSAETTGRKDSVAALSLSITDALREIREAEQFIGSEVKNSAELRALCGVLAGQLRSCASGGEADPDAVREFIDGVRWRAVSAKVAYVNRSAESVRRNVGENLLHARFSEYENLFLQLSIGAELSAKSEDSPEARRKLLEWARREWDALAAAHAKLKIAEQPLMTEKRQNHRDRLRPWAIAFLTLAGGLMVAVAAQLFG